jgi:hypothetical protein
MVKKTKTSGPSVSVSVCKSAIQEFICMDDYARKEALESEARKHKKYANPYLP